MTVSRMAAVLPLVACFQGCGDRTPTEICGDGIDNDGDGRSLNCPLDESDADLTVVGSNNEEAGSCIAFVDADADGRTDLLVCLEDQSEDTYPLPRRVAVVPHQISGSVDLDGADWIGVTGSGQSIYLGAGTSMDGVADNAVFVQWDATWLLAVPLSDETDPVAKWLDGVLGSQAVGDFNGDGSVDVAFSPANWEKYSSEEVLVYLGPLLGAYHVGTEWAEDDAKPADYRILGTYESWPSVSG